MKNKTNWYLKLISHFYGIREGLDEYQIQEINRIGNNAFLFITIIWPILIVMTSFLVFLTNISTALITFMVLSIFTLVGVLEYVALTVSRLHLNDIDSYDENDYHTWIKKTKHRSISMGITFFVVERIFQVLFNTVTGESFWGNVFSVKNNLVCLIVSILLGFTMYYSMKKKIKKP